MTHPEVVGLLFTVEASYTTNHVTNGVFYVLLQLSHIRVQTNVSVLLPSATDSTENYCCFWCVTVDAILPLQCA